MKTPTKKQLNQALEASKQQDSIASLGPSRKDLAEQFGSDRIRDNPDGTWECHYHQKGEDPQKAAKNRRVFQEMTEIRRRKMIDVSHERNEKVDTVSVRMRDGVRVVPAHLEDTLAKKGARPVKYWGRTKERWINGKWYTREGRNWVEQDAG